ncbi:MAG TPA: hypothetical protein VMV94_02195 [Phycisphaerae bacterium]|nr:hypothetical protein [Phycisphaerae bacterium]
MRARSMRVTRLYVWAVAIAAAFVVSACSQEGWKMDWWNQEDQPQTKPRTAAKPQQRPATESKAAQPQTAAKTEKAAEPEDPQSREVQAKVDRYVQAMGTNPDGARGYNDFNSKIERQQDPNRKSRVRRVAEQSREAPGAANSAPPPTGPTPTEPSMKPAAKEQTEEKPKTAATPGGADRGPEPVFGEPEPAGRAAEQTTDRKSDPAVLVGPSEEGEAVNAKTEPTETRTPRERSAKGDETATARPPVLTEITVSPGPELEPEKLPPSEEPARPTPNVAAQPPSEPMDTFQKRVEEQEARVAKDSNNLAEQYRLRMMYLIDGQDEKALAPASGMDAENQQILQTQVRALISARSSSGRDPAARAMDLLTPVEELRMQLRARADLQVPRVVLCTDISGFGVYKPIEPVQFPAGQKNPVIVYIEVDNFKSEKTPSGLHRTLLSLRPSLLNKSGEELWSASHDNIEDLSRQQRHDFFLTLNETLPASLTPGEYTLKIEVEDVLAGKINSNIAKFKIVP